MLRRGGGAAAARPLHVVDMGTGRTGGSGATGRLRQRCGGFRCGFPTGQSLAGSGVADDRYIADADDAGDAGTHALFCQCFAGGGEPVKTAEHAAGAPTAAPVSLPQRCASSYQLPGVGCRPRHHALLRPGVGSRAHSPPLVRSSIFNNIARHQSLVINTNRPSGHPSATAM